MIRRSDLWTPDLDLQGLTDEIKIFLAGPVTGAPRWQEDVPPIPGVTWLSPRWREDDFDIATQTTWEETAMTIADAVVFWIPAPCESQPPGRSYAQTTRTELGWVLGKGGKKIIAGAYPEFSGREYIDLRLGDIPLYDTWDEVLRGIKEWVRERKTPKTFFTPDTHFGSPRALSLSQRPFKTVQEMDWALIWGWNSVVGPEDVVYHLGDFGETWPLEYLNGKILLVPGNYEEKEGIPEGVSEVLPEIYTTPDGYTLSHEPSKIKDLPGFSKLFGHIHGRSKIKPWGGVDVGMDAWGFRPASKEDIDFLLRAIREGYYDEEVWT